MAIPLRTLFVAGAPSVNHYSQLQPLSPHHGRSSSSFPSFQGQTIRYNTQPVLCSPLSLVPQVLFLTVVSLSYCCLQFAVQEEEDVKELVCVIGHELASLEEGIRTGVKPLIQCLRLVDLIQRLGIDRYFQELIKRIIKTTYIKWDESYGLDDADPLSWPFDYLDFKAIMCLQIFLRNYKIKMETSLVSSLKNLPKS